MKYDVTQVIRAINSTPFVVMQPTNQKCEACGGPLPVPEVLTLRTACIEALMHPTTGQQIGHEEKFRRVALATRIYECENRCDLSHEECALIQKQVDTRYAHPMIVTRVWNMLEGDKNDDD